MQLLVTLNQTLMPVEAFELGAGRREAVKADAAIDRAERGVHPLFTKHAAEVDHKLFQLQLIIQHHFQHHINCLIKQTALDRVVVELQEGLNQFFRFVILLQSFILYTSDAADDQPCVNFGGRRIITKKQDQ